METVLLPLAFVCIFDRAFFQPSLYPFIAMHFLPFVSAILATAVLVSSEQSQYNSFDITEVDGDTPSTEISYDLIPVAISTLN